MCEVPEVDEECVEEVLTPRSCLREVQGASELVVRACGAVPVDVVLCCGGKQGEELPDCVSKCLRRGRCYVSVVLRRVQC